MSVKSFRDLRTWREGHLLAVQLYRVTANFPDHERYGLSSQLRRAAVSVPSNIAEGFGRGSTKDFGRFLYIARGSVFEILAQLEIAKDLKYLPQEQYNILTQRYEGLGAGLNSHIKVLRSK